MSGGFAVATRNMHRPEGLSKKPNQPYRNLRDVEIVKNTMDKIKPYEKIADQFQISNESAKYFLNHVQKSFKTERPNHKLILEFVDSQQFEILPIPYKVAEMMQESGVWAHPLGSPPPVVVDDEDV
jgi:hypothetical protein